MNQVLRATFTVCPLLVALSASAQAPPSASPTNATTETSRISRFLAGQGDRPQGLLLRNGTFVTLSPGLAQQLPSKIDRNASVRVAGDELMYNGNKTIAARSMTVAGVSYVDQSPAAPVPPPPPRPAALTPPPPPPPPCGLAAPPPPPAPAGGPAMPVPPPPPAP